MARLFYVCNVKWEEVTGRRLISVHSECIDSVFRVYSNSFYK